MVPVIAVRLRDYLQHSPTLSGPSTVHLALPPATYVVFEHTAKAGLYDCSPVSLCVTIDPLDVSVTSQSGAHLYVYVDTSADAITDGSDHYAGALKFNVHQCGTYSLSIRSSAEASFVIAKQPSEEAFALGGWIAGGVVGLLLIAVALVGSLIARGSRRRYRQVSFAGSLPMGTAPTAAGPPPHDSIWRLVRSDIPTHGRTSARDLAFMTEMWRRAGLQYRIGLVSIVLGAFIGCASGIPLGMIMTSHINQARLFVIMAVLFGAALIVAVVGNLIRFRAKRAYLDTQDQ
jgi:hypothetical protein